MKITVNKMFAVSVTLVVIVVACVGAYLAGSPSTVRLVNLDNRRVGDLQSIMNGMETFYQSRHVLPVSLSELTKSQEVYLAGSKDPETGAAYEYRPTDVLKYELCATFGASSDAATQQGSVQNYGYSYPYGNEFWKHPAGRYCFALEVHPIVNPSTPPVAVPVK